MGVLDESHAEKEPRLKTLKCHEVFEKQSIVSVGWIVWEFYRALYTHTYIMS